MEDLEKRVRDLETQNGILKMTLLNAASMAHSIKRSKGREARRKKVILIDSLDENYKWLKREGREEKWTTKN